MGFPIIFNCLLTIPADQIDMTNLRKGQLFDVTKDGERLYPLNIPIELCDEQHHYLAKVAVRKLTLTKGQTSLQVQILKVFSDAEAQVYTDNYIKPDDIL